MFTKDGSLVPPIFLKGSVAPTVFITTRTHGVPRFVNWLYMKGKER